MNALEEAAFALIRGIRENMKGERDRYRAQNEAEYAYRVAQSNYTGMKDQLRDMCKLLEQTKVKVGGNTVPGVSDQVIREVRNRCDKEAEEERRRPQPVPVMEETAEVHTVRTGATRPRVVV